MLHANITSLRQNIFNLLELTIKYNEPITINTKDGNAVIISEKDYNALIETLFTCSVPGMREKVAQGLAAPLDTCVSEDEVPL